MRMSRDFLEKFRTQEKIVILIQLRELTGCGEQINSLGIFAINYGAESKKRKVSRFLV
jgi:hypothetical protein